MTKDYHWVEWVLCPFFVIMVSYYYLLKTLIDFIISQRVYLTGFLTCKLVFTPCTHRIQFTKGKIKPSFV